MRVTYLSRNTPKGDKKFSDKLTSITNEEFGAEDYF